MCNNLSFEEWKELKYHMDQLEKMLNKSVDNLTDWGTVVWKNENESKLGGPLTKECLDRHKRIYHEFYQADGPERLSLIKGLLIKLGMPDSLWNDEEYQQFHHVKEKRWSRKDLADGLREVDPTIIQDNPYLTLAEKEAKDGYIDSELY